MEFVQERLKGYEKHGVVVSNFSMHWRDGKAFCGLLHQKNPNLFDWNVVMKANPTENLNRAFDLGLKHYGIPKLLDAEDITDMPRPDSKSIITYLSLVRQKLL